LAGVVMVLAVVVVTLWQLAQSEAEPTWAGWLLESFCTVPPFA
jgi:hypothetical protein